MEFLTRIAAYCQWTMTGRRETAVQPVISSWDRLRAMNHYVRDTDFYRKDGDCVILVENTIFKIHRYLLATDSSAFVGMFELPSGTEAANLMTEDDPLQLPDNLEEFRALCWALYALPSEIQTQNAASSFKFQTVLDLLSISHKYQFDTSEKWAAQLLLKHFTGLSVEDGTNEFLDDEALFDISNLEAILRLFVRVDQPTLREAVEQSYMRRLSPTCAV